ncbi:hypothetical protein AAVH_15193 [Aphelenchoides avenae]|nr:hypothetical protein AAVH_15193 [Aphelenchus avenae]
MTTHGISTDISTEKSHDVTTNKPAGDARTTAPHAKGSTAREGDHSWREKVDSYAKDIIDSATDHLQPKSWKDRQSLHEAVANGIVKQFHESSDNNGYSFEALAYLPYNDDKRHAFIKLPDNIDVVRKEYKLVNYVVARRANAELGSNIRSHWDTIENNANAILEDTLALAALRCGYEFVWYELGYRYFPAGYATGKHILLTQGGNEYTDKCGQIVFFP